MIGVRVGSALVLLGLSACNLQLIAKELPSARELGTPHGYELARTIMHLHSPYSWDSCDKKGLIGGQVNAECLADLRFALCEDRVDFAFLTDHTNAMVDYEFDELLIPGNIVSLGTSIKVLDLDTHKEMVYHILGPADADLKNNIISFQTPLAKGFITKKEGDTVTIQIPDGSKKFKILKIEKYKFEA